ncbi:hypothetical protein GLOIN_2v1486711 [Rhizophagus clarus]|uniref:Uncharacterized protein n=1 Tax=Rhizophagus clarus TaxID=94130 RepID=A0A8H3QNW1_9GLOM|nr:hypothetical protein GLOIN_2v1486711 [Rhizophagus clarus]
MAPICSLTDMEIDDLETLTEQNSSTAQKKRSKLTSPESLEDGFSQDPLIILQSSISEMDINLLNFLDL